MTRRKEDEDGKGEATRNLLKKPSITIPITIVVTLIITIAGFAYGFGQSTAATAAKVEANATSIIATNDRIDRGDKRLEKALDDINDSLDELVKFLRPSRWEQ
ncbi:hypothetical protein LCGC14_1614460 [marine sediment metagenome]|uniref:Uncharacterized protein n=1 Tax=marine sediment metagenome TaxID=412755 RepID=A0A0F9I7D5_9ZZZZ